MLLLFLETFFMLLFGHCLADFPLQGEYLSKTKNPKNNYIEFWLPTLFAHSVIHAGIVFIITGYISLAIFQLVTHFIIDYAKAVQKTYSDRASFLIDQFIHIAVLGITAGFFVSMTPYSVR